MKGNAFEQKRPKIGMTTNVMVRTSLFTAISVLLKLVFEVYIPLIGFPALRINLTSIPIMLSGIICGPIAGLLAGAFTDMLCYVIKPAGAYFPAFTITSALTGLIPGLIYKYFKKERNYSIINTIFVFIISGTCLLVLKIHNDKSINIVFIIAFFILAAAYLVVPARVIKRENVNIKIDKILFTVSITQLITSLLLNTYFLSILYGKGFMIFLPGRVLSNFVLIPLYTIILSELLKIESIKIK